MKTKICLLFFLSTVLVACSESRLPPEQQNAEKAPALTEASFRKQALVKDDALVEYQNESGKGIPFDDFLAAVSTGRSFSKEVSLDGSRATFGLNSERHDMMPAKRVRHSLNVPLASLVPELPAPDLDGQQHELQDGEKYTLLSFFFAECLPCIQEIPELNAVSRSREHLKVVSITYDSPEEARKFTTERGLATPVIASAQEYIDALGVTVYPTLALISPDGRLVSVHISRSTEASGNQIETWLSEVGL